MNTYFRLLSFARPFGLGIPAYFLVTILYSIFSVVNLAVLIPLLQVLFDQVSIQENIQSPDWNFSLQFFKDYFQFYFKSVVIEQGKSKALQFVCVVVVCSFMLSNLFKYLSEIIMITFKTKLIRQLRTQFFERLLMMDAGFFSANKKGDIMSKGMNDIQEVENTITHTLKVYAREPFLIIAYFVALFSISLKLTLITLILLPVSGTFISYIARKLKRKARMSQQSLGSLNSILDEMLGGMRIIKAFNAQTYIGQKFKKEVNRYANFTFSMQAKFAMASPVSEFLGISVVVSIIIIGGNMILEGSDQLNASQFITFVAIFSQVLTPAKMLSNAFSFLQRGLSAGERVFEIMDTKTTINEKLGAKKIQSFEDEIRIENISFQYENEEVLKSISFSIKKGETVALVGPSGGGKSTLVDLIPRFYDVQKGVISIDGQAIEDYTLASLRQLFGIVTQESILFNDSIFNNIAFGKPDASLEEVIEAARIANALEFIDNMEHGFDSQIGDRGSKLSGGQKQRISIARAILKNPQILILDEATSALDTESEKLVQEAIQNLMENRTAIVIAHRLSTIQNADKIIVIEKGRIVEQGTHNSLLMEKGLYYKLINLQSL